MKYLYLFSLVLTAWINPARAEVCGSLLKSYGPVEILRHQSSGGHATLTAHSQDSLDCKDVIVTRSSAGATVSISRGKFVIGADSRLEVAQYDSKSGRPDIRALNLIYGRARFLIAKRSSAADSHFEVRTPTATVGVRGTDFFVEHDAATHVSRVATIEGTVEVTSLDTGKTVLVSSGRQLPEIGTGTQLQPTPMNDTMRTEVQDTSKTAMNDADFTPVPAVSQVAAAPSPNPTPVSTPNPQSPAPAQPPIRAKAAPVREQKPDDEAGVENPNDRRNRLILTIGPAVAGLYHVNGQLNSDARKNQELALQYERITGDKAWIGRLSVLQVKDDGTSSLGVENEVAALTAEVGLRFHPQRWWGPYVRAGLAAAHDEVTINRADLGYYSDTKEYSLAFVEAAGVDVMLQPKPSFGFYAALEAQAMQSPFTLNSTEQSTGPAPSYAGDNANPWFLFALNLDIGIMAQF